MTTQQHLDRIWETTKDIQIEEHIKPMFGSLSSESIKYFLQTGTVNGNFNIALHKMMDGVKNWKAASQSKEEENISVEMMRTEGDIKEWERLRELFSQKTSVPKSERGLRSLNCFIEGYNAAKEELESKEED